jgi:hypothetical protein
VQQAVVDTVPDWLARHLPPSAEPEGSEQQ